jgi:hypothetical protein
MLGTFTTLTVVLLAVWLIIFYLNRELRQEMLILSICAFFLAPVILTMKGSDPNIIAERFSGVHFADLLFSFAIAGLAGSLFHAIFGKHYHRLPKVRRKAANESLLAQIWLIRMFIATLLFLWGIVFFVFAFDLSPAPAALATGVIMAIYIVIHRYDLLADTLVSAALTGVVTYMASAVTLYFSTTDLSSLLIADHGMLGGVPMDLITWSAAFGLALGPLYEYIRRLSVR